MIFSKQQTFSDNQAITATALSTNVIDLGVPGTPHGATATLNGDVGKGTPVPILIQVTEDFDNLTSLNIAIEAGETETLGTVILSQDIPLAELIAGKQTSVVVMPNGLDQRYVGVRYTVTGTAPTAGMITAKVTMGVQTNITGA